MMCGVSSNVESNHMSIACSSHIEKSAIVPLSEGVVAGVSFPPKSSCTLLSNGAVCYPNCSCPSSISTETLDMMLLSLLLEKGNNNMPNEDECPDTAGLSPSLPRATVALQEADFSKNVSLALNKCLGLYILPFIQNDSINRTVLMENTNGDGEGCITSKAMSHCQINRTFNNKGNTMVRMLGMIQDVFDSPLLFQSSYEHFVSDACGFDTHHNKRDITMINTNTTDSCSTGETNTNSTPFFEVEQCYVIPIPGSSYLFWGDDDENCSNGQESGEQQENKIKRQSKKREGDDKSYEYNDFTTASEGNIHKETVERNLKNGRRQEEKNDAEDGDDNRTSDGDLLLESEFEDERVVPHRRQRAGNINDEQDTNTSNDNRSYYPHNHNHINQKDRLKKSHKMMMSPNHPRDGTGGLLNFPCAPSSISLSQAAVVTFLTNSPLMSRIGTDGRDHMETKGQHAPIPMESSSCSLPSGTSTAPIPQLLRPNMIIECFGFIRKDSHTTSEYQEEEDEMSMMLSNTTARFEKLPTSLVKKFICIGYRIVKSPLDVIPDTSTNTSLTNAVTEYYSLLEPSNSIHAAKPSNLPAEADDGKEKMENEKCITHSTSNCLKSMASALYQDSLKLLNINYNWQKSVTSTTLERSGTPASKSNEIEHCYPQCSQWQYYAAFLQCILAAVSDVTLHTNNNNNEVTDGGQDYINNCGVGTPLPNRASIITHARNIIIQYLTHYVVDGDVLSAEYLLLHLISVVDFRHMDSIPVGDVPMRLLTPPKSFQTSANNSNNANSDPIVSASCSLSRCCSPAALDSSSQADENIEVNHLCGHHSVACHKRGVGSSSVMELSSGAYNSPDLQTTPQLITSRLRRIVSFGTSYIDLSHGLFNQPIENVSKTIISKEPSLMPHKDMEENYIATGPLQLPSDGHHLTVIIPKELHVNEGKDSTVGEQTSQWCGAPTTPSITPMVQDELLQLIHKQTTYIAYPFGKVTIPTDARVLVVQPLSGHLEGEGVYSNTKEDNSNSGENSVQEDLGRHCKYLHFISPQERERITRYSKEIEKRTPAPLRVACTLVLDPQIKEKPGAGEILIGSRYSNDEDNITVRNSQQRHLIVVESLCRAYLDVMRGHLSPPVASPDTSTSTNESSVTNQLMEKITNEYRHYANIHQETLYKEITSWQQSNRAQFNSDSLVHNNTLNMVMSLTKAMGRSKGISPYVSLRHSRLSTPESFVDYVMAMRMKREMEGSTLPTHDISGDRIAATSTASTSPYYLFNPDNYTAEIENYFREKLDDFYDVKKLEQKRFERNLRYMYIPTDGCA